MTSCRDPVQTEFVESKGNEASGHFGGVTKTPRVLGEDVSEFTVATFPVRQLKAGSADQIAIESDHRQNK
jgi:hypothetical protein